VSPLPAPDPPEIAHEIDVSADSSDATDLADVIVLPPRLLIPAASCQAGDMLMTNRCAGDERDERARTAERDRRALLAAITPEIESRAGTLCTTTLVVVIVRTIHG